jgi:hypothetical protein
MTPFVIVVATSGVIRECHLAWNGGVMGTSLSSAMAAVRLIERPERRGEFGTEPVRAAC